MAVQSRQIVLARYAEGLPRPEDFRMETVELPDLEEGQFLVRNFLISLDTGTRSRLSEGIGYLPPIKLGNVVESFSIGEVVESRHPKYARGEVIGLAVGWSEYVICSDRGFIMRITDRRLPWDAWLGVLGISGMAAYFGLHRVGGIKAEEVVLVTAAAGAVGSAAVQIAKNEGCRVIGIDVGPEKCGWLREVAGIEDIIDYTKAADLFEAVREVCPDGVDVLFENVGNAFIDQMIPLMKMRGRIVICGQTADYNLPLDQVPGVHNIAYFIEKRLRMEGMVVFDDLKQWSEAQTRMADWIMAGDFHYRSEVIEGLEAAPEAYIGLLSGEAKGRRVVRIGPDPA